MFEYFLVVASTLIYFRVFHRMPTKTVSTQTDPWEATQILDLMDVSSETELGCSLQLVDWFADSEADSSELELPPMVRQQALAGFKENSPETE